MTYAFLQCGSIVATAIAVIVGVVVFRFSAKAIVFEDSLVGFRTIMFSLLLAGITILAIIGTWYAFSLKIMGI